MTKKVYKQKSFSLSKLRILTEILTKNLLTFKKWDEFKDGKF